VFEYGQQAGGAAGDLVQDGVDRRAAGRDGDVDAHALEQSQVRRPRDAGDHLGHTQLTAEQRSQQVALVVVDDAHQHVAVADVLGLEELEVGAIAVEHQRAVEPRRQRRAAFLAALDHPQVDGRGLLEPFGQLQPDVAAADDGDRRPRETRPSRASARRPLPRVCP
jgi:hypothetical protein